MFALFPVSFVFSVTPMASTHAKVLTGNEAALHCNMDATVISKHSSQLIEAAEAKGK